MKYYLIQTDPDFTDSPKLTQWRDKIDLKNLTPTRAKFIEDKFLVIVEPNPNLVFTDIISTPFFMVSKTVSEAMVLYEPHMIIKRVILLEQKIPATEVYYIPFLRTIDCLTPDSDISVDRSIIRRGVIDTSLVGNTSIFKIGNLSSTYIAVRMDLAESILRRPVRGIRLEPLYSDRAGE